MVICHSTVSLDDRQITKSLKHLRNISQRLIYSIAIPLQEVDVGDHDMHVGRTFRRECSVQIDIYTGDSV